MAFTFFFRDLHVIELVARFLVPDLAGRHHPLTWDAGCAMGQEPYTLAMVLAERMNHFAFSNLKIHASDLDDCDTFGDIIKKAVYPRQELERIPPEIFQKYFEPDSDPDHFRVVDRIRDRIVFHKHNLTSLKAIGGNFSLVLCKNVLLHLQQEERIAVMKMFHAALTPGGLMAFEQTQKLPPELSGHFEQIASDGEVFRRLEI